LGLFSLPAATSAISKTKSVSVPAAMTKGLLIFILELGSFSVMGSPYATRIPVT
jgi:hypothetical protein